MSDNNIEKDSGHRQQQLEENVTNLQHDILQLSQEVFAQQKEITSLLLEIQKLRLRLEHEQNDSGILRASEDKPPPHY